MMIGMKVQHAKAAFLDRAAVQKLVDRRTRVALNHAGALVRKIARNSIRPGRATSRPGQPPRSHTGLLKRFLFYAYDTARRSVVVGPARLNTGDGQAPARLEYGGQDRRRARTLRYLPRPYMGPALTAAQPRIADFWSDRTPTTDPGASQ